MAPSSNKQLCSKSLRLFLWCCISLGLSLAVFNSVAARSIIEGRSSLHQRQGQHLSKRHPCQVRPDLDQTTPDTDPTPFSSSVGFSGSGDPSDGQGGSGPTITALNPQNSSSVLSSDGAVPSDPLNDSAGNTTTSLTVDDTLPSSMLNDPSDLNTAGSTGVIATEMPSISDPSVSPSNSSTANDPGVTDLPSLGSTGALATDGPTSLNSSDNQNPPNTATGVSDTSALSSTNQPSSTNTSTASGPSSTGNSTSSGDVRNGHGTFYDPSEGGQAVACGDKFGPSDKIVAVAESTFNSFGTTSSTNDNPVCGKTITAKCTDTSAKCLGGSQPVTVTVVDKCGGCGPNDLDFTPSAFDALTGFNQDAGNVTISWQWA